MARSAVLPSLLIHYVSLILTLNLHSLYNKMASLIPVTIRFSFYFKITSFNSIIDSWTDHSAAAALKESILQSSYENDKFNFYEWFFPYFRYFCFHFLFLMMWVCVLGSWLFIHFILFHTILIVKLPSISKHFCIFL